MKFVYLLADGNNQSGTYAIGDDAQSTLALFNQRLEAKTGVTVAAPTGKTINGTINRIVRTNNNGLLFIMKNSNQVYKLDTSAKNFKPIYQFIAEGDKVSFKAETINSKNDLATANVSLDTFKDQSLAK